MFSCALFWHGVKGERNLFAKPISVPESQDNYKYNASLCPPQIITLLSWFRLFVWLRGRLDKKEEGGWGESMGGTKKITKYTNILVDNLPSKAIRQHVLDLPFTIEFLWLRLLVYRDGCEVLPIELVLGGRILASKPFFFFHLKTLTILKME